MFGFHKEPEFHPVDQAGATALGWTSIGIGLAEIAAPRQVESMLGIGDGQNTGILRVLGVREICHGIDLLSHKDPAPGLLSRIAGVYGGAADKIPVGALMNKGLTIKTGQTHVHKYVPKLLDYIRKGEIDPSFVVTHRIPLSEAAYGYHIFREKRDGCIKIVLDPAA